jgi:hypothetical protein
VSGDRPGVGNARPLPMSQEPRTATQGPFRSAASFKAARPICVDQPRPRRLRSPESRLPFLSPPSLLTPLTFGGADWAPASTFARSSSALWLETSIHQVCQQLLFLLCEIEHTKPFPNPNAGYFTFGSDPKLLFFHMKGTTQGMLDWL